MRILFFSLISLFVMTAMGVEPAQLETSAIKLSKALRGIPLSVKERQELAQAIQAGQGEQQYQKFIQAFLQTDQFRYKLKVKVDELVRVRTEINQNPEQRDYDNYQDNGLYLGAYDYVVRDVISQNQSWDQLLLAHEYRFQKHAVPRGDTYHDQSFFSVASGISQSDGTMEDLQNLQSYEWTFKENQVKFEESDERIAGILTTPRFMHRYVNTALNKSRRRASAVFRIFLCDSMMAAIPPTDAASEKSDFDMIFPHNGTETEQQIKERFADPHGTQADCMSCHYKLDPMGQVFGFSSAGLAPSPTPGALRYKSLSQGKVDIAVNGVRGLAKTITQQQDYVRCQVNHFWNWYVGKDFPKSEKRTLELMSKFDEVGRKPKDFIAYLVTSSEFRSKPQILNENQILARRAGSILKNCFDCHRNQNRNDEIRDWDLTEFPYKGDLQQRQGQIEMLVNELDLTGDGSKKTMPPKSSVWKLSDDQHQILKRWVEQGAPDYDGKPQVNP